MDIREQLPKIQQYYADIDQSTRVEGEQFHVRQEPLERVMELFAPNAVYMREKHPVFFKYEGRDDIRDFFANKRSLAGNHNIISIEALGDNVGIIEVKGHFSGIQYRTEEAAESQSARRVCRA